ncbi:MAG: nucleoside monophosphate kinase [bacterium]|nr:nucleoside monophosphate kinase [bacterium]
MPSHKNFPLFNTKVEGVSKKFDLNNPAERKEYFEAKAGKELEIIRNYLKDRTFVAYLLGKKGAGKGTYTKLLIDAVGEPDKIAHVSVGDIVRAATKTLEEGGGAKAELEDFLRKNYRGFMSLDEALGALASRSTKVLVPTEFTLSLIKWELREMEKKTIFLDGFPRDLDQISYAIFFRDLIGYREDPDFFVFINLPESVIDARMKSRVICPKCQTPRNVSLMPTKDVGYDEKTGEFFLRCDNADCAGARMVAKEGDDQGIEAIRGRMDKDEEVMSKIMQIQGIDKVLMRNTVPVSESGKYVDDYEITPAYVHELNKAKNTVETKEEPWVVEDDDGVPSYSLLPPPVALSMIKQLAAILEKQG